MTKFTGVSLIGHLGYRMSLPLADGITVLTGENAAGKSALASTIPGVLFDLMKPNANATLSVSWERDGAPWSATIQTDKAKKPTWRMSEAGSVIEHRLKKDAKKWLAQHLALSYGAFSTVNFISALRGSTILSGNATACNELLAEIVSLTVFSSLRDGMRAIYNREGMTAEVRARIEGELNALSESSHAGFRVIKGIDNKLARLQESKATFRERANQLSEQLDVKRPLAHKTDAELAKLIADGDAAYAAWRAYDAYEAAPKPKPLSAKRLAKARELAQIEALANGEMVWRVIIGEVPPTKNPRRVQRAAIALAEERAALRVSVDHLKGAHDADKCPTCRNRIDTPALLRTLSRTLRDVETRYEKAQDDAAWAEATVVAERVKSELRIDGPTALALARDLPAMEEAERHNARCGPPLAKVARPKTPRPDEALIEDAREEVALRARGFALSEDEATDRFNAYADRYNKTTRLITALSEHRERQLDHINGTRRVAALRQELDQLPNTDELDLMKEVLKQLENRNARDQYLEMVGAHLVAALNRLSRDFYTYPVEFAWQRGNLIANRKGAAANVSTLSGHESRVLLLLMAMASQECLPERDRVNTLVLDEIESGSKAENRHALAELLPRVLDNGYDNLLVVSPQTFADFPVHGRRYRVEADKTLRRLE